MVNADSLKDLIAAPVFRPVISIRSRVTDTLKSQYTPLQQVN